MGLVSVCMDLCRSVMGLVSGMDLCRYCSFCMYGLV